MKDNNDGLANAIYLSGEVLNTFVGKIKNKQQPKRSK